jgi:hypothetical protein
VVLVDVVMQCSVLSHESAIRPPGRGVAGVFGSCNRQIPVSHAVVSYYCQAACKDAFQSMLVVDCWQPMYCISVVQTVSARQASWSSPSDRTSRLLLIRWPLREQGWRRPECVLDGGFLRGAS